MHFKQLLVGSWDGLKIGRAFFLAVLGSIFAFIAASNFSLTSLEISGRYIPEPLIAAWLIVGAKIWPELGRLIVGVARSKAFLICFILILVIGAIGALNGNGLQAVYGDIRASTLLIFSFLVAIHRKEDVIGWEFFLVSVFAVACLLDCLRPQVYDLEGQTGTIKTSMSFWAAVGLAVIGFRRGSILLMVMALVFSAYFAKTGFFRLYFFGPPVICLIMFLGGFRLLRVGKGGFVTGIVLIAVTVGAILLGVSKFWGVVDSLSETVAGRMHAVDRTNQLIEGLREGDVSVESERYESFKSVMLQPYKFILPYGSGWRGALEAINRHFGAQSIISTMDSAFFYLAFHYGIFVFYAFSILAIYYVFKLYSRHRFGVVFLSALVVLALAGINLFTEAGMFTIVPRALQFGVVLGVIYPNINAVAFVLTNKTLITPRNVKI